MHIFHIVFCALRFGEIYGAFRCDLDIGTHLGAFSEAADRITVRRVLIIYTVVLGAAMLVLGGWAAVLAALLVFWRYYAVSKKQFGGITGDLAGWFLQRAELAMLAALAVCQWGGIL